MVNQAFVDKLTWLTWLTNKVHEVYYLTMTNTLSAKQISQPTTRLLLKAFRQFESELLLALAARGFDDISTSHLNLIRHLNPEGMKLSDLAKDAALSKQAISKISRSLIEKNYLEIQDDPIDARAKIIRFTPKGELLINTAVPLVIQIEQSYLRLLGEQGYQAFREALIKLLERNFNNGTIN